MPGFSIFTLSTGGSVEGFDGVGTLTEDRFEMFEGIFFNIEPTRLPEPPFSIGAAGLTEGSGAGGMSENLILF